MFARNKLAMVVAEFLGTAVLTLLVLTVQRSTIGGLALFVAITGGLAFATMAYIFSNVSGAHFNPAITIGAWAARKVKTLPALAYIAAQLLGGWAAYGVYTYFVNTGLQEINGSFTARIMLAEALGLFIFAFVWAAVAAQKLTPSLLGAGLTLGMFVASVASIGFLNPALALASRAWEFNVWAGWSNYVLGPVAASIVAFYLYDIFFSEAGLNFGFNRATAGATVGRPVTAVKPVRKTTVVKKKTTKRK